MAGNSQKVGCLYRFDARVFWCSEDEVVITMHQPCHVSDSSSQQPCHGPDSDVDNPRLLREARLSSALKAYVMELLQKNRNMPAKAVVHGKCCLAGPWLHVHVQPCFVSSYCQACLGLPGAKEAAAAWRLHSVTAPKVHVVCLLLSYACYTEVQKLHVLALKMQQPDLSDDAARQLLHDGKGHWAPRDYFITHQDVINIRTKLEQLLFRHHSNDALSVRMLYQANTNKVCFVRCGPSSGCGRCLLQCCSLWHAAAQDNGLCRLHCVCVCVHVSLMLSCVLQFFAYREQQTSTTERHPDGRPVELSALLLGIMTDWQRQQAWELGHGNAVLFDTTFGTNKYGVS